MLNNVIKYSLKFRGIIIALSILLLIGGFLTLKHAPVDVFPDLTAPTVTIITEARGFAPEEVELLVTFPLESVLNGAANVRRVRSVSTEGLSILWVEFNWGEDIYRSRQIVNEKLQLINLPDGVDIPQMGSVSSIMGEIMYLAVTSDTVSPMDLRRLTDVQIVRKLQAVPGISKVMAVGGDVLEYQIITDPLLLSQYGITLSELFDAVESSSSSPAAGFYINNSQEYLVRGLGRVENVRDLSETVLKVVEGVPITVSDVATVKTGTQPKRGIASFKGKPAIVISLQKQPGVNTINLTEKIDTVISDLVKTLPKEISLSRDSFRQADFINLAVHNISSALRDGALLVIVILFFFLGNFRSTVISALAIPLSLMGGILVISYFGYSINTMTLGGLTIAIGALVDDAIIDVENVFRRLKQEQLKPVSERKSSINVVFSASSEVRSAIFFATLIIILVFTPVLFLPGMEGRLLKPLGLGYMAALASSLLVSLTVTPVLCLFLLTSPSVLNRKEPKLVDFFKQKYKTLLFWSLENEKKVLFSATIVSLAALITFPFMGKSFLPEFNEGAFTITVASPPGIPLNDSDTTGRLIEEELLRFPEVVSTSRRTGRGDKDEHGLGVNASEIEVVLREGRDKETLLHEMRKALANIPGANKSFGQPISHRIEHMISGSKTNLAIKVYGENLSTLRKLSDDIKNILKNVPEIVDISNQEQSSIPQLVIDYDRKSMARYNISSEKLSRTVEAVFQGSKSGEIIENGIISDVVIKFPENLSDFLESIHRLPVITENGSIIFLEDICNIRFDLGPSMIRRENVQRLAVVTANISGHDKSGIADKVKALIHSKVNIPDSYSIQLDGQFEEAGRSFRNIMILSLVVFAGMFALLFGAFKNTVHTMIVLVNLPLAMIGGVIALFFGYKILNVASLMGFITLFGIATRNGVLLVSHYQNLMAIEGKSLREAVIKGSQERLSPVLMTAITAGLALVPLLIHGMKAGNEIQSPMAQVIVGGLISSTFLNMIVVPLLFLKWGGETFEKHSLKEDSIEI